MYYISTEKEIPVNQLMNLMKQTYWAPERSEEDVLTAMKNSVSFGAFDEEDNLVGFARVVTDFVSIWYLCDVIVDDERVIIRTKLEKPSKIKGVALI